MKGYFVLIISAILVNNFVLSRFLGICPFLGVSREISSAIGMSGAVIFVMTMASAVTWCVYNFILLPLGLEFLQTIVFILVIASFVQLVEIILRKTIPVLHSALGIYLPLITTNCAVLGVALLSIKKNLDLLQTVVFSFASAVGFSLALLMFSSLREKIDRADPPEAFKGVAIALVTAGLLSLAFMGFIGLVKE